MNMGGGILLRTVARAAAGSTTPAASTGFCSACTGHVARPSSLRTICGHTASTSSKEVNLEEEWDFTDEPNIISESANRTSTADVNVQVEEEYAQHFENQFWHVFGPPPSIDEANAATSELQAALFSSKYSVVDEIKSTYSNSTALEYGAPFAQVTINHKDSDTEEEPHYGEWVEPQLFMSPVQVAKSPVQEAFQLLQSDPNVKGAIISIVSDPDVWHAMMKNEKVQELKHIFQKSQGRGEDEMQEQQACRDEKHNCLGGVSFLVGAIVGMSRQVIWQVQDDVSKIISCIFSLVTGGPKCASSGKEDPAWDKTMRSSMMIAVLVVTILLMKRVQA